MAAIALNEPRMRFSDDEKPSQDAVRREGGRRRRDGDV